MNPRTCTYDRPITLREIKRHNQFKGAYGNLTQDLDKDLKNRVRDILRGLELCGFSVEKITLVKKYVDAIMRRTIVTNRFVWRGKRYIPLRENIPTASQRYSMNTCEPNHKGSTFFSHIRLLYATLHYTV